MNTKHTFKALLCSIFIWAGMSLGLTSCESYLDVDSYFYDQTNIDSIFQSKVRVNEYINGIATKLPNESKLFTESSFPFGLASDECFASWPEDYGESGNRHSAMALLLGNETPQSAHYNNWATFYQGIRKANIVLTRINECKELSDMERRDYTGRAYFLRGYFYFCLLRQYGPVPIVPDKPFDADTPSEEASVERNTYDECVDYICNDMEKASEFLQETRTQQFQNIPTKGAALAVISRLRLYAASPWYNGNNRYTDWKTSDGRNYISPINNNSKWGVAAVAAKRIINMNKYKLYTTARTERTQKLPTNIPQESFPNGAGNIDPYASYKTLFDGSVNAELIPEYIYYCDAITGGDSPQWLATPTALGGVNGINICMDLVDSYKMIDGHDIHHSSTEFPYPNAAEMGNPIDIAYRVSDGYTVNGNVAKVDAYREPRFYATIGYNHCIWPGTSYVGNDPVTNVEVTYYSDGNAGPLPEWPDNYNRTGYTVRKYINQEDNLRGSSRAKTFAVFRYAEILLNYVEALNELEGSYTDEATGITVTRDTEEMKIYFNMIRYRSGMPAITDTELNSKDAMREAIKSERKIEFALEGHRYHDLRRWGDADAAYNTKIIGWNTKARANNRAGFYTRTIWDSERIQKRVFTQKMYFFPIPQTTLDHNAKLVQNPGW